MSSASILAGPALVLAPMTRGGNLPYRRLCQAFGASVTMGEMALVRRLQQRRRAEFALIQRAPDERCFGVQLAGRSPDELRWGAELVASRGADIVDLNLGCPIDEFTRRGLGSALLRQPRRIERLVAAMKAGAGPVPVTVKIRLGWNEDERNAVDVARAAETGGADALTVHGRTRSARYRFAADWEAIGEVAAAVRIPVVGNGDILFPEVIARGRAVSGVQAVMIARGALIKPWIFAEALGRTVDDTPEGRVAVYRDYVRLAREHFGDDERGHTRLRPFLVWHLGFWCRHVPRRDDGTYVPMQERATFDSPRSPLEALLARPEPEVHEWIADRLLAGDDIRPEELSIARQQDKVDQDQDRVEG
ncbi:MAG: tRNA-dihydrouridine synthase family protein [Acidobacteria bacterium]|nr:tRNA-dihydrouridine synthase family protein [Acidobacteriota bacterium]